MFAPTEVNNFTMSRFPRIHAVDIGEADNMRIANNIIEFFSRKGKYPQDSPNNNDDEDDMCYLLAGLRMPDSANHPKLNEIRKHIEHHTSTLVVGKRVSNRRLVCDVVVDYFNRRGHYPSRDFKITDKFTAGSLYTRMFDGFGLPTLKEFIESKTGAKIINTYGEHKRVEKGEEKTMEKGVE